MALERRRISNAAPYASSTVVYVVGPLQLGDGLSVADHPQTVTLAAGDGGPCHFYDHLAPECAEELAVALTESARGARIANGIEVPAGPGVMERLDGLVIKWLVDEGREHDARERFGDAKVDRYFSAQGEDPHAARCDCDTPTTCDLRDQSSATLHPILAALQAVVDQTPDHGEGSRFHHRSEFAWETIETYRTADEPDTIAEYCAEISTGDQVRACCLRDAAKATHSWLMEDALDLIDSTETVAS